MEMNTVLKEIEAWPLEHQIELVQQVWDRIVDSGWQPSLTEEQKAELDRRLRSAEANPDDVVDWDSIVAQVRRRR